MKDATRLCLKTPSSARERAIFSPGKACPERQRGELEAGDVGSIVDAAGCSQAGKGPLEARSSFQTVPWLLGLIGGLIIVSVGMSGCKDRDSEVKTYRTDKAPPAPQVEQLPQAPPAVAPPQQTGPFAWDLPEGWTARPGSGMRLATFVIPVEQNQVECSMIALGGPAGGVVANVNRWRGQIGLPAVDAATVQGSTIKAEGQLGEFQYVKLINEDQPGKAFLAAILPAGERTLFIKIDAPAARLDALESSFVDFCKSVKRP